MGEVIIAVAFFFFIGWCIGNVRGYGRGQKEYKTEIETLKDALISAQEQNELLQD